MKTGQIRTEVLQECIKSLEEDYQVPGGELLVRRDGETLFSACFGDRLEESGKEKDLYWLYSMSKVYTAVSMMQLWERGKIHLDDLLVTYFPELRKMKGKDRKGNPISFENVTISNLLSMTAGLNYEMGKEEMRKIRRRRKRPSADEIVQAIYTDAAEYEPGTEFLYGSRHDICGAVIEKVTERSLDEYMKQNIWEPLEITDIGFFPDEAQKKRFADQYEYVEEERKVSRERLDKRSGRNHYRQLSSENQLIFIRSLQVEEQACFQI